MPAPTTRYFVRAGSTIISLLPYRQCNFRDRHSVARGLAGRQRRARQGSQITGLRPVAATTPPHPRAAVTRTRRSCSRPPDPCARVAGRSRRSGCPCERSWIGHASTGLPDGRSTSPGGKRRPFPVLLVRVVSEELDSKHTGREVAVSALSGTGSSPVEPVVEARPGGRGSATGRSRRGGARRRCRPRRWGARGSRAPESLAGGTGTSSIASLGGGDPRRLAARRHPRRRGRRDRRRSRR